MSPEEIQLLGIEELIVRDAAQDPKYTFIQNRILHKEKGYLIPIDENIYVLRGNDPFAPIMAKWYYDTLKEEDQTAIVVGHQETSIERVSTFEQYHKDFPEMIGNLYPEEGCACIITPPSISFGTDEDPMQDPEYALWNFRLFHRYMNFYVPDSEPVMVFRSKDALLVKIIDKHNEFIEENREVYGEKTADVLINFNNQRREKTLDFHIDHPERVGVTCAVFQKPKGAAYKEVLDKRQEEREKKWEDLADDNK